MSMTRYRRYSGDRDFHLGPYITLCRAEKWHRSWGIRLDSGAGEYPGCNLMFQVAGHSLILELPAIIKPWRDRYDEHAREYGFSYNEGFLQVYLGRQTHSSETTQQWSKFLPWTQWRHIRKSLYGLRGEHFATDWDGAREFRTSWEAQRAIEDACPSAAFEFNDYDGERIKATTRIEEREWRFGTGWFRWLSLFRRPKVRRSLSIEFSAEVGREKGSWKGGTLGHGIEMLAGEMHEAAFLRYCAEEHRSKNGRYKLTYVGRVPEPASTVPPDQVACEATP